MKMEGTPGIWPAVLKKKSRAGGPKTGVLYSIALHGALQHPYTNPGRGERGGKRTGALR